MSSTAVQRRRGTTAQHASFAGLNGELTVDTDKEVVVVHDGTTAGGYPQMRENGSNSALALGSAATPSLKFTGDTNTGIYSPGADQVSVATGGTERLRIDSTGQIESVSLGTAAAPAYTWVGDPNTGIYSPGADQVAISTNGTGRLFVDASGNVGIGQSSVTAIYGRTVSTTESTGATLRIAGTTTSAYFFTSDTLGYGGLIQATNHPLIFGVNSVERLRITSAGNVGIGTSSPNSILTVAGGPIETNRTFYNRMSSGVAVADRGLLFEIDGTQYGRVYSPNGKSVAIQAGSGTLSDALTVDQSGRVGIGTTSPTSPLHVLAPSVAGGISALIAMENNHILRLARISPAANPGNFDFTVSTYGAGTIAADNQLTLQAGSSTPLVFNTSGANERARIDSSGRLLVGTSSARSNILGIGGLFQQEGANNDGARMFSVIYGKADAGDPLLALGKHRSNSIGGTTIVNDGDGVGQLLFTGSDGTNFITAASIRGQVDGTPGTNDMPGRLVFSTTADGASSPTERMRIRNDGRILLGTTTDGGAGGLTVRPSASEGAAQLIFDRTNTTNTSTVVVFENNDGTVGTITYSNTAVAYNTTSDYRLKENVVPLTGAANRLNQLQVHRFNFIADPDKTVDGFLAHEAQAVVPECVTGTKDEIDDEGNPVYQGIDQSKLVPLLTAALQEALAEIASLKDRVAALEAQ